MKPNEYLTELALALKEYRVRDVRALTDRIDPSAFQLLHIKKALGLMRRKRLFSELDHAASLFHMVGHTAPVIRRQWAQSLLDQNRVTQALTTLEKMSDAFATDPDEGPEIRGLIGRAYKQLYLNEGGAENLQKAIAAYEVDWKSRRGDYRWQGINVVALLERAKIDGVKIGIAPDTAEFAQAILDDIDERGAMGAWDYATAMEACVARADTVAALDWARQYVLHPGGDAFELASTLRQLEEVWRLTGTAMGDLLLPVLASALLQREGATLQPIPLNCIRDPAGFEAVWGSEGIVRMEWLDALLERCKAVARISDVVTGQPEGTGFLMNGASFGPVWADHTVFITNSHVVSANPADEAPLRPEGAVAEFTRLIGRPKINLGRLIYCSPRVEMDVSIFEVNAPSDACLLESYPYLPKISANAAKPERIYIVGHPNGAELAVSLYDNSLVEYERQYVRYRSPTEGGSSGSPVFNAKLKSFAAHHRALYDRQLNEGVVLQAIVDEVQRAQANLPLQDHHTT